MNNQRTITPDQIEYLHAFCKKKDIEFIDLRIELVDHLIELIEARWQTHPNEDFVTAFHQVYKSFGIFGFMNIAEQHQRTMSKFYWQGIRDYFKSWLTPPKVIFTATFFTLVYFLVDGYAHVGISIIFLSAGIFACSSTVSFLQYKRNKKILNGEQNMLMSGSRRGTFWVAYLIWMQGFNFAEIVKADLSTNPWFCAILLVFSCLFAAANHGLMARAKVELLQLKEKLLIM